MALYIHCPNCYEQLEEMHQDCTHCGVALPPGVLYALASALGKAPSQPQTATVGHMPAHLFPPSPSAGPPPPRRQNSTLRPWLAAALSLFCGLGQLYNGQVIKGMILIVLGTASLVNWQYFVSQLIAPLLWLYAIVDAYLVARRTVSSTPPHSSPGA
ncbi:hypothetical protein NKDENANG_02441 [Candidatus Entotheonellaceae bacterium PAL068K]